MTKKFLLSACIAVSIFSYHVCCAQGSNESLTITTYYPSPYGSYNELSTAGNTYLATDSGNVGIGTNAPQSKLDVRGGIKVGDTNTSSDGAIRFHNNNLELYKNGKWQVIGSSEYGTVNVPVGTSMQTVNFTGTYTSTPTVIATAELSAGGPNTDALMVCLRDLTNMHVTFDVDVIDTSFAFHENMLDNAVVHYIVISKD